MSEKRSLKSEQKINRSRKRVVDQDENEPIESTSPKRTKTIIEEEEERLHPYCPKANKAIRDRIQRALNQRLYLLASSQSSNPAISRHYQVLGHTGNVYTVIICQIPSCTCPDHAKGFLCKHIIFVLHRVLKVQRSSPLIFQKALLKDELREIFYAADRQAQDVTVLAERAIIDGYQIETGQKQSSVEVQRQPVTDDDPCAICFETMSDDPEKLIFCSKSCGKNLHEMCFNKWKKAKLSMKEKVTCPLCRVPWEDERIINKKPNDSYLNLAAYSTMENFEDDEDDDDYHNHYYSRRYYRYW